MSQQDNESKAEHFERCEHCQKIGRSGFTAPDGSVTITVFQVDRAIDHYWKVMEIAGAAFREQNHPIPWVIKRSVMLGAIGAALDLGPEETLRQCENLHFQNLADSIVMTAEMIDREQKAELS